MKSFVTLDGRNRENSCKFIICFAWWGVIVPVMDLPTGMYFCSAACSVEIRNATVDDVIVVIDNEPNSRKWMFHSILFEETLVQAIDTIMSTLYYYH